MNGRPIDIEDVRKLAKVLREQTFPENYAELLFEWNPGLKEKILKDLEDENTNNRNE